MNVKVLSSGENSAVLLLEKTEPSIANALRRTLLGEIPVIAVRDVTFYENTSAMPDEYIAHRLAMVPLKTDLKAYKAPDACCGGNCASCSVDLTIDEAGPKTVTSASIKTSDTKIKPVSGKIPIIELMPGQRLRLEAKGVLGRGEEHVKWQVGVAGYKYLPVLKADYRKINDAKAVAAACPTGALKPKSGKLELDPVKCTHCEECVKAAGEGLEIGFDRTSFIFRIETNGQMTAKEALLQAIKSLGERITNMQSQL
ncbi:MAG: DNA-directed RNA polymerase subunit D [Candidatus Diapherotrites archaeon]|nr:DNA-directed RNA polymerase subunit D [Candidatus Diapherotrites archaeon]